MGLFSYLKPADSGKKTKGDQTTEMAMAEKAAPMPLAGLQPPGTFTPGNFTPGNFTPRSGMSGTATPYGSRPASLYPAGDFRNLDGTELMEIKCDVMVNWLYQQQMERLWTAGGHDEGIMLKKLRGSYACCPADLVDEPYGFFKAIETLNVRVSFHNSAIFDILVVLTIQI